MSFQQGLSGLNVASKSLDAIGNNVANSGTAGFKSSSTQFADVYAASLTGAGAGQIGIGANLAKVNQQFTQGNITTTNNPFDVAINGRGFFRISDNGAISYSRNGQFQVDKDGYVVTTSGFKLQGYPAIYTAAQPEGLIVASTPTDILIDPSDIAPKTTSAVSAGMNLDSRESVPSASHPFSIADPLSYNASTSITSFDSLGNPHTTTMYFVKSTVVTVPAATNPAPPAAAKGRWDMYMSVDGTATNLVTGGSAAAAAAPYSLYFDSTGSPLNPATLPSFSVDLAGVMAAQTPAQTNTATTPLSFTLDFSKTTQYGSAFGVTSLTQDGFTSGRLSGISVSSDGIIQGNYTNGQSKKMAQLVLANFNNPNGLQSLGGNRWLETAASGAALVGAPGTGANGVVQSGAIEESNVDLTSALVDMITQQRAYQANAQTIKTQDSVLQTLVNLR